MPKFLENRSVVEIMVIVFTGLVAFAIVLMACAAAYVEVKDPRADTRAVVQSLFALISAILGALLGVVAGRASKSSDLHKRPDQTQDDLDPDPEDL